MECADLRWVASCRWESSNQLGEAEGNQPMSLRNAALAGMIGPAVFALIVVVLTLAQYRFLVRIGWDPVGVSEVPWPSGLALGPLGWLQRSEEHTSELQ